MHTTQDGLWLIGIGGMTYVAAALLGSERPGGGIEFSRRINSFRGRLFLGIEIAALAAIAAGGVMVMATEFRDWWIVPISLAGLAAIAYGVIVWKLHDYWLYRKAEIQKTSGDPWQYACAELCTKWRWAFLHPFAGEGFPEACYRLPGAPHRD